MLQKQKVGLSSPSSAALILGAFCKPEKQVIFFSCIFSAALLPLKQNLIHQKQNHPAKMHSCNYHPKDTKVREFVPKKC